MGVLEIFDRCPGDLWSVSWRFLVGVLEILVGILEIFYLCPGDISTVCWRYFISFLQIFDRCNGGI